MISVIILGVIQGLTEFLPISSSGHLVLAGNWLNIKDDNVSFELLLHFGTLLATALVFRKQILAIITGALKKDKEQLILVKAIVITTIPTALLGKLFEDPLERLFDSPLIVSFMLLLTGAILYLPKFVPQKNHSVGELGWIKWVFIGVFQAFAIIPGISRSGTTITTGLLLGLSRKQAGEYSFLISLPIIAGACVFKIPDMANSPQTLSAMQMFVGTAFAFIVGWVALKFLLYFVQKGMLHYFSWYCWAFGGIGILTQVI